MDHLKILKRAWHITYKYRALWLVGLLLVLAGGGIGGGFRGSAPGSPGGGREIDTFEEPERVPGWPEMRAKIAPILAVIAVVIVFVFLLAMLIGVALAVLRYITRTSLIQMVQSYEETGEEIGFGGGMRLGWSRSAFHLFLINLSVKLPLALLMILLIGLLVAFAVLSFVGGGEPRIVLGVVLVLLIIPIILLGVAIRIVVGPILEIAYRTCVIEGLGAWEAIRTGFGLIRRHLGPTALQWLLLVGLRIAWGIVLIPVNLLLVVLAAFVGGLPALLIGGIATLLASWPWGLVLGGLVFILALIVVVSLPNIALGTLATVYHSTAWTLTYRELKVLDTGAQELAVQAA